MESNNETSELHINGIGVSNEDASEIGKRLQKKRQENSAKSIEDIAKELKLNANYLYIIESGEWDSLPSGGYGRGYIRMYAKHLAVQLPEFENFLDVKKVTVATQIKGNLEKLIEFARAKRLENKSAFQRYIMTMLYNVQHKNVGKYDQQTKTSKPEEKKSKKTTVDLVALQQQKKPISSQTLSNKIQPNTSSNDNSKTTSFPRKKVLIIACSFLAISIGVSWYVFNERESENFEITSVPITEDVENNSDRETSSQIVRQDQTDIKSAQVDSEIQATEIPNTTQATELQSNKVQTSETQTKTTQNIVSQNKNLETQTQKMKIDILEPVAIQLEADGKQILNGTTNPGTMDFEFQKNAVLIIQDSSKVKLSYAGWQHETLSVGPRKRIIMLNAKRFSDEN